MSSFEVGSEPSGGFKRYNKRQRLAEDKSEHSASSSSSSSSHNDPATQALKEKLLSYVYGRIKFSHRHYSKLPGPLPATVNQSNLKEIQTQPYWVCEKSDGERMILFISKDGTYLIDRKFSFVRVNSPFYSQQFGQRGDTILDGELMKEHSHGAHMQIFMIFDAIMVFGQYCGDRPFSQRCAAAQPVYSQFANPSPELPLHILFKTFVRQQHLPYIFSKIRRPAGPEAHFEYVDERRGLRHKNDGIIFTPENDNYLNSQKPGTLLKWKWPGMNTVDFKAIEPWYDRNGNLQLYAGGPSDSDIMVRSTPLAPHVKRDFERQIHGKSFVVVECAYIPEESAWTIKGYRPDKPTANYITTVISTLETIIDNVGETDLTRACVQAQAWST